MRPLPRPFAAAVETPSADGEFFASVDAAEAELGPIAEDPADPEGTGPKLPPIPEPTHVEHAVAAEAVPA